MDDVLTSHANKELLTQALDDIVQTLENHGFLIKRIISNKLRYHQEKGLLSDPDTSTDGTFTAEEVEETTFHHTFNWKHDTLKLNLTLNVHPKSRVMSAGPDLDETDVEKFQSQKLFLLECVDNATKFQEHS